MLQLVYTPSYIHQDIRTHKGVSLPTLRINIRVRQGLWKWVQLYFWFKTNKQTLAMVCSSAEELTTDGSCLLLMVSAQGDSSSHSGLVSWSPNWSQPSKDHPTQYYQLCSQNRNLIRAVSYQTEDRTQIPEQSPHGSQGVISANLSASHPATVNVAPFTQPCKTPVSWNTFSHGQQCLHFFLSLENSCLKA